MSPRSRFLAVASVLFISGFCSLVYQVAWFRLLRLVFGNSTGATAAVLAIFMGGLGYGGVIFGRRSSRSPRPLVLYGKVELGIALTAAASPWLVELARAAYTALSPWGSAASTPLRLLASLFVLGGSSVLMGGTLPLVAQAVATAGDRGRRRVATLYGANTAGAVVGAFLTAFVFIELVGVNRSIWLAAVLNAGIVLWVRRLAAATPPEARAPALEPDDPTPPAPAEPSRVSVLLVLVTAALAGFVFFLMELVWYRLLAPILGGTSYTFGMILAVALTGLALGGLLYAFGSERRRPTLVALATTASAEALLLVVPFALGDRLAVLAQGTRVVASFGFSAQVAVWLILTVLVVMPAAVVSGYQLPLCIGLLGQGRRGVGRDVGRAYAWNTWGSVAGALAGGFGLLPLLSAPGLWRGCGLALLALAVLLAAVAWRLESARARLVPGLIAGALAAALLPAEGPTALWRHTGIGVGRFSSDLSSPNLLRDVRNRFRRSVVDEVEGVESGVAILAVDEYSLIVNGKSDGSAYGDAPTVVMSAIVPAAYHPAPKQVLVIGLGTGTTAGWLAAMEGVERVDVVELEPSIVELSERFRQLNQNVLERPEVRMLIGDGREYVQVTDERYDIIFSEPSNPYRAGVADLFSADFYASVRERLTPGGIFAQWVQGYDIDAQVIATVYATLGAVFPQVDTWGVNGTDLLLVGTMEPQALDGAELRRRLAREPYRSGLWVSWGVAGTEGLLSGFTGGAALAAEMASRALPSTDDRPRIEFGFARNVGRSAGLELADLWLLSDRLGARRPRWSGPAPDWGEVDELRLARMHGGTLPRPTGIEAEDEDERRRHAAREAYRAGQVAAATRVWASQSGGPLTLVDHLIIAEGLVEGDAVDAEAALAELSLVAPVEAALLAATLLSNRGDATAAVIRWVAAVDRLGDLPWIHIPLLERTLQALPLWVAAAPATRQQALEALRQVWPADLLGVQRRQLAAAVAVGEAPEPLADCVRAFEVFEPFPEWNGAFLAARFRCYEVHAHRLARRARRDWATFRALGVGYLNLEPGKAPPAEQPSRPQGVGSPGP